MISLNNGYLRIDIDENARVTHFEDLRTSQGNLIIAPEPLYRLNLHTGSNYEDMAFPEAQEASVRLCGGAAVITLDKIVSRTAVSDIQLEMRLSLDKDRVRFGASVENRSESTVAELFYPCLGMIKTLDGGKMKLLWPEQLGKKILDVEGYLVKQKTRQALHTVRANYPGPLSMSWMMLQGRESCLYLANYDPKIHVTSLRARSGDRAGVTLEIDKMCFVKPGARFEFPETVARLYTGDWKEGAREYAEYANTWRKPVKTQDWVRRMNGYFLVINRQQYGDDIWPYDSIPKLYELAQAHGYDTLGLFGWYATGHDNNYPDLEVSETMGGREKLCEGIKAVQEKGGHVTLYYQGHLIDVNSPFYKKIGYKIEGRTIYNNPYYEFYPKACNSDFAKTFSRRVFSTACPSCPEWQELMAERIDWIDSFGPDGTLYDQIGGMPPYPCFNEEHPHADGNPSLSCTQGRLRLFSKIRAKVKNHKDFAFFSEHVTDVYSQFLDCVHGIGSAPSAQIPEKPADEYCGERMMPALFRYCFPGTCVTIRNPMPCTEQRYARYAFAFGLKLEMELRYLSDRIDVLRDFEPGMREYCKAVADFRRKHEKYLLLGSFRADEGIENPYETLIATRFVAEDGGEAVALWNDSKEKRSLSEVKISGRALSWESLTQKGEGMPESLESGEIALVFIE